MDAFELTMKCSKLLQRPYSTNDDNISSSDNESKLVSIITENNIQSETLYIIAPSEEMGEVRLNINFDINIYSIS
jgi:hypothetical protein